MLGGHRDDRQMRSNLQRRSTIKGYHRRNFSRVKPGFWVRWHHKLWRLPTGYHPHYRGISLQWISQIARQPRNALNQCRTLGFLGRTYRCIRLATAQLFRRTQSETLRRIQQAPQVSGDSYQCAFWAADCAILRSLRVVCASA